jgi:hypothetical protein
MQIHLEKEQPPIDELQEDLHSILSRELTVDTIATYGEDVIRDLTGFSYRVTRSFQEKHSSTFITGMELEDEACSTYRLPLISELLDKAQEQDSRIKQAGSYIAGEVKLVDSVITPPDEDGFITAPGSGNYEKPVLKNRLQTVLYIVQELGVDLSEIVVKKGKALPTSVRNESYVTIEIPSLKRLIYVCDEEQNASFIFDSDAVIEVYLTIEDLDGMTKGKKNELIELYPKIGRRFVDGSHWVSRLKTLLSENFVKEQNIVSVEQTDPWRGFWQSPTDGKHYGNLDKIYSKLGVGRKFLEQLNKDNVSREAIRSGGTRYSLSEGYAVEDLLALPELQEIMAIPPTERSGEWSGFYTDLETGHHYGSANSLAKKLGISGVGLASVIERMGLEPTQLRGATRLDLKGYSYELLVDDKRLYELMNVPVVGNDGEWKGFWTDENNFHWGSVNAIRNALGVHSKTIKELIDAANLASTRTRNNAGSATDSYKLEDFVDLPRMLELTTSKLVDADGEWQGFYTDPETGEHWAPLRTIANRLGTGDNQIKKIIQSKDPKTISIRARNKRSVGNTYVAYSLEQIAN